MFGCHNSVVVVGFLLVVVVLLILCWRRRNIDEPVYDCMCSTSTQSMAKFVIRQMVNARCWQPMSAISIDVALFTERCKKKPRQQTGFACSTICKGTTSHFICFTHTRAVRSQPLWISCHLPLNCYNIIYRMCVWVCVSVRACLCECVCRAYIKHSHYLPCYSCKRLYTKIGCAKQTKKHAKNQQKLHPAITGRAREQCKSIMVNGIFV